MILEFLKKYEKESIIISILLLLVAIFLIAKYEASIKLLSVTM